MRKTTLEKFKVFEELYTQPVQNPQEELKAFANLVMAMGEEAEIREKNAKRSSEYIREQRKTDPYYARTPKEVEKLKRYHAEQAAQKEKDENLMVLIDRTLPIPKGEQEDE